ECARIAAQGELAADGPERAGEMPGAQVEIPDHGITAPVPVARQIEHLAAEPAPEGGEDVAADRQLVEITRGRGGKPPHRLITRLPGDPAARRKPQRIT